MSVAGADMPPKRSMKENMSPRAKRQTKTRQNRRPRMRRGNLPAAILNANTTSATILQRRNGTEMVIKEIFPVIYHPSDSLDFVIPFTPTKWQGTRTSTLLSTFSAYRPRRCIIRWNTALGTTTNGNIAIGTSFDGASFNSVTRDAAYQALPTTNAGVATVIYRNTWRGVALSTSLRANLYPTLNVDQDDIPFWILAVANVTVESGTKLGDIIIESVLSVHNPITVNDPNPCANNITMSIEHSNENNTSTLSVIKTAITQELSIGKDYYFSFNRPLWNTASAMLAKPLKLISANLASIVDNVYKFQLDSATQSVQSIIGSLIGPSAQQFFQ